MVERLFLGSAFVLHPSVHINRGAGIALLALNGTRLASISPRPVCIRTWRGSGAISASHTAQHRGSHSYAALYSFLDIFKPRRGNVQLSRDSHTALVVIYAFL